MRARLANKGLDILDTYSYYIAAAAVVAVAVVAVKVWRFNTQILQLVPGLSSTIVILEANFYAPRATPGQAPANREAICPNGVHRI